MKKLYFFALLLFCLMGNAQQNLGLGGQPDPSAQLDLRYTTGGFLLPRLTLAERQAISNPAPALQIYNTTSNCIEIYVNSAWQPVSCPCAGAPATPGTIVSTVSNCVYIFSVTPVTGATSYNWTVPSGASIIAGWGSASITVNPGRTAGNVSVVAVNNCGTSAVSTLAMDGSSLYPAPVGPISGDTIIPYNWGIDYYSVDEVPRAFSYSWTLGPQIYSQITGRGTPVLFGGGLGLYANSYIFVNAYNTCGSSVSDTLYVRVGSPIPLAKPASNIQSSQFDASWTSSNQSPYYLLDLAYDDQFTSFVFQDQVVYDTLFTVTGLPCNTPFYYRVRAADVRGAGGDGNYSDTIAFTTPNLPTAAPVTTAASDVTDIQFTANWNASSGALSYQLDVSSASNFSSFVSGYQNLDVSNVLSYSVTGLTDSTTYYYRVRAVNGCGISGNSNTDSGFTTAPPGFMQTFASTGTRPLSIAFDGTNMWTANVNGWSVTKVTPAGVLTDYPGTGPQPTSIAFDGVNMWTSNWIGGTYGVTKIEPDGITMTTYDIDGVGPEGIAFDGTNMWVTGNFGNSVTKVAPDGSYFTYGGTGNGVQGIAFDSINRYMWTCNYLDNSVTRVAVADGSMNTYSGTGNNPVGIAFDGINMWTTNSSDNSVTKVAPNGDMTIYSGTGSGPYGIAFDGTNMWTANENDNSVTRVAPDGSMTTYYGTGSQPTGIAFDGTYMWTR